MPVLPAQVIPGIWTPVAVPPVITACIIVFSVAAVAGFIACFHTFGLTFVTVLLPPGAVTFLTR